MTVIRDYTGQPLSEGAHVEAWRDGVRYTATVKEIRQQEPGSGYRRVILVRDSDHVEIETFSDAVTVLGEDDEDFEELDSSGAPDEYQNEPGA